MPENPILVINTGSSSLKLGLYLQHDADETLLFDALADGINRDGTLTLRDAQGKTLRSESLQSLTQQTALSRISAWLAEVAPAPSAVGHRVVHGGPRLTQHQLITPALLDELRACIHFAPLHIPPALDLIAQARKVYPALPQYACFDTAFHQTMPEEATRFPLPRPLFDQGIRRYGFHGLSYESIVHQRTLPPRTVVAHLGSGASLAALLGGRSVDTSMGLTPTGGIPMGTRTGDLDPGILLYLLRTGTDPGTLEHLLDHNSGLRGISGGTADMRDLTSASQRGDQAATLAITIFCRAIAKTIAAYATVLGGLDAIVFTGGIGERSGAVRAAVCQRLAFLGIEIDVQANAANSTTISTPQSRIGVSVIESQEDLQIARHCRALLMKIM